MSNKAYSFFILITVCILITSFMVDPGVIKNDDKGNIKLKNGDIAPDIELCTPEGNMVKLSSLRGSIVLIDFWASWCKGCRIVGKQLKPIFEKYKNQRFTKGDKFFIYSVCLDTQKDRWLRIIEEDSLQGFINVSDLKGFDSKTAKDYKLGGLPSGYIIDGDGIIIGNFSSLRSVLDKMILKEQE